VHRVRRIAEEEYILVVLLAGFGLIFLLIFPPALVVNDSWLNLMAGREVVENGLPSRDEIKRRHPEIKVVMLSASQSSDLIEAALRRGASAYVVKTVNPNDLPATLRQALEGNIHTAVGVEENERAGAKALGLTERELTILGALARGLSNDEIAKEFWVAPQTVKFHLTNIYRKLGVKNRTEATRLAYQHGLVESPIYADE